MFESNPDEQNYSPGAQNYYGPQNNGGGLSGIGGLAGGMGGIKKMLPTIIVIIILLVGGLLAYTYFSSQKDITLSLVDPSGAPISGKISLKDSSQKSIALNPSGVSTSFTAKLFTGDYSISATAAGYKPAQTKITVENDSTGFDINMTRDLKATLGAEFEQTEIYEGQTLSGKIAVTNTGQEFSTSDIISSSDSPLLVTIAPSQIDIISTGGSIYMDFNVTIKYGSNLKEAKPANISFKISGSTITSNKVPIQVLPAVAATSITLSGTLNSTSLTAGKEDSFQISVKNGGKLPLKQVVLEIIPDEDSIDKLGWFRFINPSDEGNYKKVIELIDPSKTEATTLYVKPPITAKKGDYFKGILRVSSISINGQKNPLAMNYIVSTEKTAVVNLMGADQTFTINCPSEGGACETKNLDSGQVYLINSGNVDVGPIKIEILQTPPTTSNCYQFLTYFAPLDSNNGMIDILSANSSSPNHKATIMLDMTAPEGADEQIAKCAVQWKYIDPASEVPNTVTGTKTILIQNKLN